ncbi:MAG: hypothetical protein ACK4I8_09685 [Armatimonadota bacterium]
MKRLSRRELIEALLVSPIALVSGCSGGDGKSPDIFAPPPDLVLDGNESRLASLVRNQFSRLYELAQNPGSTLRIGIPNGRGMEVLRFSFHDSGAANYRHLRVVRESTGEVANLLWGWKGLMPSIKFTDDWGNVLRSKNGQVLEIGFADVKGVKGRQASDLIATGVKVAAIAFAIWLGAGIARGVLSAIGFLAFNAMVLGLLAAGIGVISPAIGWVLKNITLGDVERFFGQLVNDIIRLFEEISLMLAGWLK